MDIKSIKEIGRDKKDENFQLLLNIYYDLGTSLECRTEVVSSIGRYGPLPKVFSFIEENFKNTNNNMDMVYQMYRTCLRYINHGDFAILATEINSYYKNNEVLAKMTRFHEHRIKKIKHHRHNIDQQSRLWIGENLQYLTSLKESSVGLVFTSPPYYNAREYSSYKSYADYLKSMASIIEECHRVLEEGRLIVINVSPVISKRPGREFESTRYPIPFDFHRILTEAGFDYIDDITWLKSDYSVPNRNAIYIKNQVPLSYKPNPVTESLMVYRKRANFLIDENIKVAKHGIVRQDEIEMTCCWQIEPKRSVIHPAIFPENLCRHVIHYYSFSGDVVMDPFAGSCTVGKVASQMNRKYILMEREEAYTAQFQQDHQDVLVSRP